MNGWRMIWSQTGCATSWSRADGRSRVRSCINHLPGKYLDAEHGVTDHQKQVNRDDDNQDNDPTLSHAFHESSCLVNPEENIIILAAWLQKIMCVPPWCYSSAEMAGRA